MSGFIRDNDSTQTHKSFHGVLPKAAAFALLCASLTTFAGTVLAQQGTFVPTGNLNTGRMNHTATLLNNGTVLITGGNPTGQLASAELYDPTTGTFTLTGSMNDARVFHTATLLNNGKVLITGSRTPNGELASAELYDPPTGTFTLTGSMNTARYYHTATLLNNGKVLITGGIGPNSPNALATAELYDPTTGSFTLTGSMSTARYLHTATLLTTGLVLIATGGVGIGDPLQASAELYDPTTGTFTLTGNMNTARFYHTATLLNSGKVLIAGGRDTSSVFASAELYDATTGTFTLTGSMNMTRWSATAALLNSGQVLVAGGFSTATAELFDPTSGSFSSTGSMNAARDSHTATLLNNGIVLIAGGENISGNLASAELYEQVVVSPTGLSFSNQVMGTTSASQTVTLTNNQSTALTITGISFSGTNASDFAETDNCIGSVAAGAGCTINVTFTPAALGSRAGTLNIANNISGNPLTVPLSGTGVTATQIVSLSTSSLTFTNQIVGSTSPAQGITLTNTGNSNLIISGLAISGPNASEFAETDNCVGSVAAGATCTINVTFAPTATGTRTATLSITDNATSPPSPQTVALTGTATAPSVSVTPSSIAFPAQYVGTSGLPQSVTVMNNGNAPLSITSVTTSATDFGTLNACGNTVAAGTSCAIGVFFDPTASGTRSGTLTINDNGSGSPQTVALTGTGQDFSIASPAPTAAVAAGQTATFSVSVSPSGGFSQAVSLSCTGAPSLATCNVAPSSVTLNGTSATSVTVTVTTTAPSLILHEFPRTGPPHTINFGPVLLFLILLLLALMASVMRQRKERERSVAAVLSLALLLCAGITLAACGGGSASVPSKPGTQPGNYSLTVSGTFTSGSTTLAHSTKLTLVVQ